MPEASPRRRQAVLLAHNASVLCLFLCLRSAYGAWNSMPGAGAAAAATALLEDNYRVELGATIPSPLIDSHQVAENSISFSNVFSTCFRVDLIFIRPPALRNAVFQAKASLMF